MEEDLETQLKKLPKDLWKYIFRFVGPPTSPVASIVKSERFHIRRCGMLYYWRSRKEFCGTDEIHHVYESMERDIEDRTEERIEYEMNEGADSELLFEYDDS